MATTNPAYEQLYPLSTADHEAIPHDVAGPEALIKLTVTAAGITSLDMSATTEKIMSLYSQEGCIIQFTGATLANPPVSGTVYDKGFLVPPGMLVVCSVTPGVWKVVPFNSEDPAILYIQFLRKWVALSLERQVGFK